MKAEIEQAVVDSWLKAGMELGIRVQAPFEVEDEVGRQFIFVAYLPDFGSAKGAVFLAIDLPDLEYDREAVAWATDRGYYWSILNRAKYLKFDPAHFMDTLNDLEFFGDPTRRPPWYTGAAWGQ